MYRVGFGDFFLVTLGEHHIIIDCGVFKGTSATGDIGSIEAAIADMVKVTNKKLALIVMTHRHADHIAGFGRFVDVFRDFTVDAVWMPAWEDEYNPTAKKFQAEMTALATQMQAQLDLHLAAGATVDPELYHRIGNATGNEPELAAAGGGGSKNAIALDLLKTGLKVKPAYLKEGDPAPLPASLKSIGLSVQVLGPPPVEDVELMKLMDLKKNVGEFLAIASGGDDADGDWEPFSRAWYADPSELESSAFGEWISDRGRSESPSPAAVASARKELEKRLQAAAPSALDLAAKQLDAFLNNQSLVLLFTYKGKNLLFVGDAQGGNWEHWLYETDSADKAPTGPIAAKAKKILDTIDVYKVGHHGSTNATPIAVAREIREGSVALCSTQKGVYGSKPDTAVPLAKLIDALDERVELVRSDQHPITVGSKKVRAEVNRDLPEKTDGTLTPGQLWIDYAL